MTDAENLSPVVPTSRWSIARTLVRLGTILGIVLALLLAARTGLDSPSANPWLVSLDVAVGLAFIGGALVATGPWRMRVLVGLVGASWLTGSIALSLPVGHQGALLLMLASFPAGRLRGVEGIVAVSAAVLVALAWVPQGLVALLFGVVAVRSLVRRPSALAAYPFVPAVGVALALGGSWLARALDPFGYDPVVALVGYSVVLMLVAIGFPVATRTIEDRTALRQRVLRAEGLTGLDGLGAVLADALGDRSIRVYRWDATREAYIDSGGGSASPHPPMRWLAVMDGSEAVGAVAHRSMALDDERTAAAIVDAVRLALVNLRVQQEVQDHLRELEAVRARLQAMVDRERAAVAARLRDDVMVRIGDAAAVLREGIDDRPTSDAADAVAVALGELDGVSDELMQLVDGLGPAGLGNGGLPRVLREVATRSALDVEVLAEPDAVGDVTAETALYYACLEATANAAKHASARKVRITIRRGNASLEAIVTDDGVGGANPEGSGLRGLADRLAASGGRLRVDSPPGAGTMLTAEVPANRSSATPSA